MLLNSAAPQAIGDAVVRTAHRVSTPTVLVQLTSGAGKNPYPGWSSYCAGKAATDMWCRTTGLEQEMRSSSVSVLSLAPGVVATEMQAKIRDQDTTAFPNVDRFRDMHEGGALRDPDVVGAAIFDLAQRTCDDTLYRGVRLSNGAVLDLGDLS